MSYKKKYESLVSRIKKVSGEQLSAEQAARLLSSLRLAAPRRFVDLGLPSGRLWATENEPGFRSFDEAVKRFGNRLPKISAWMELYEECVWMWDAKKKGYTVTGPNGNSLFLPAAGYRSYSTTSIGLYGFYWSSVSYSDTYAYYLHFYAGNVYPSSNVSRCNGFSVRLVREPGRK